MRYTYILICAFLFSIFSCAKTPVPDVHGAGVGRIDAFADIALNSNPQPEVVKMSLVGIKAEVPMIKAVINADAEMIADQQVDIAKKDQRLERYKYQWVGDRAVFYLRWIIGGWISLYVIGLALNTMTGGFGLWIGRFILNLIPSPIFWLRVK